MDKKGIDRLYKFKSDGVYEKKELKWYSSDSKTNFNTFTKKESEAVYNFYKGQPFTYKFNNYGFRTPDNLTKKQAGNVYLGCSHTAGVGLPFDETWVSQLNEEVEGKCFNLAVPAAAPSTMFRLLSYYKDVLKIQNVFHYSLTTSRYEFVKNLDVEVELFDYFGAYLSELEENNKPYPHDNFIMNSLLSEEYKIIQYIITFRAIKNICDELGVNYYLVTDVTLNDYIKNNRYRLSHFIKENNLTFMPARDSQHYDTERHWYLFNCFLDLYRNNEIPKIDYKLF